MTFGYILGAEAPGRNREFAIVPARAFYFAKSIACFPAAFQTACISRAIS